MIPLFPFMHEKRKDHIFYIKYSLLFYIISEEGEKAREWLEAFADSDRKFTVVATTAELLSTGVDVPSCRNIVFAKTLSSPE